MITLYVSDTFHHTIITQYCISHSYLFISFLPQTDTTLKMADSSNNLNNTLNLSNISIPDAQSMDDGDLNDSVLTPKNPNTSTQPNSSTKKVTSSTPKTNRVLPTYVPDFDSSTRADLLEGKSHRAWGAVVDTLSSHFLNDKENSDRTQTVYRAVGQAVLRQYPCLRREGTFPWVCMTYNFYL